MEEMNTTMNASAASSWLSDLEMDEYNLFPEECPLKLFDADDGEFLSHDIAGALLVPTLQQPLTSESTSTTLSNSFTDETSFDFERPTKLLKTTIENRSSMTENFSPKLSPSSSSSISSFHSQILSFDNPNASPPKTTQFYGFESTLNPKHNERASASQPKLGKTHLSTQNPNGSSKNENLETKTSHGTKRSPAHAQDHIMAERKRREKLSQSFIALAALVPGLKKMDKASVLADAIKYVKELKGRLEVLEEQNKKTKAESVVVLTKPELCSDDDSSSCDESIEAAAGGATESLFQVEARVSGQEILIRIHCQKYKGLLVKIISEIQSSHLFVVNSSVLPFGDSILDITIIAQMGEGYHLTIKELVKNLRIAALKFMS